MANRLASLRNRRFVVPVSVDEVMMRINDAGCNVPPATYKKYESGILKLNKLDVINALCKYYGISTSFFSNDNVHLSFKIPELFEFDKNRINKWVPVYDDFYQSRKRFEVIDYPYLICNLVEYQGYHILLNGDAFDIRRRASDEYQETVGKPKGFTELEAWASGMMQTLISLSLSAATGCLIKLSLASSLKAGMSLKRISGQETADTANFWIFSLMMTKRLLKTTVRSLNFKKNTSDSLPRLI